jgi:lysophospholipase L1-like esterase
MNKNMHRFRGGRLFASPFLAFALFLVLLPLLFLLSNGIESARADSSDHRSVHLPILLKDQSGGSTLPGMSTPTPGITLTPIPPPSATATLVPTPTNTPLPTPTSTTAPGCPAGMVSCWRFDEASGSDFLDSAGPNAASCSGAQCPERVSGISSRAVSFDGIDDTLVVPHHPSLAWGNWQSFSVEAWVKVNGSCAGNKVLIGKPKDPDGWASWWLGCSGVSNTAAFYVRDSDQVSVYITGSRVINDGKWHHLVGVRERDTHTLKLYVDGKLDKVMSEAFTGNFANLQPLTIGSYSGRYYSQAVVDEAAVYTSALSPQLIQTHYYLARPYCQVCSTAVRVMPLGDSITVGSGPPSPYNGYRRPLFHALSPNYSVDFKGGEVDGIEDFDRDHEGHGGWHAAGHPTRSILDYVYSWVAANPADVILLHIGTNDINDGGQSAQEVAQILDEIDRYSKNITVILALIINRQTYSAVTTQYNNDLLTMANQRIASGDKIIVVNMETALAYPDDMIDLLHPNTSGYAKMAEAWRQALGSFLPDCP